MERREGRFGGGPWTELTKGKPITDSWLAQRLRRYGIRSKTVRIGEAQAKGYLEEDFQQVFPRYIPKAELRALLAEFAPPAERGQKPEVSGEKPAESGQKTENAVQEKDEPGEAAAAKIARADYNHPY